MGTDPRHAFCPECISQYFRSRILDGPLELTKVFFEVLVFLQGAQELLLHCTSSEKVGQKWQIAKRHFLGLYTHRRLQIV